MYIIHYLTNNVLQIVMQWKLGWVTAEIKKKHFNLSCQDYARHNIAYLPFYIMMIQTDDSMMQHTVVFLLDWEILLILSAQDNFACIR